MECFFIHADTVVAIAKDGTHMNRAEFLAFLERFTGDEEVPLAWYIGFQV